MPCRRHLTFGAESDIKEGDRREIASNGEAFEGEDRSAATGEAPRARQDTVLLRAAVPGGAAKKPAGSARIDRRTANGPRMAGRSEDALLEGDVAVSREAGRPMEQGRGIRKPEPGRGPHRGGGLPGRDEVDDGIAGRESFG